MLCAATALGLCAGLPMVWSAPAGAVAVNDESTFRAAWSNPAENHIDLTADITLTCNGGVAQRNSATALTVDGYGHSITETCANRPALVVLNDTSVGGSSPVVFRNVTINRGIPTNSVALTSSLAGGNAPNGASQVISVDVRRKHKPRGHQPRRHLPRSVPAAPVPAQPVQAALRFTG